MGVEEHLARGPPEGRHRDGQLDDGGGDHDVVEVVPLEVCLGDHGRGDQRGHDTTGAVEGMHHTQALVCIGHISNPGVPSGVTQPVSKAGEHVHDHEDGVRRVHAGDDVGDDMAGRGEDRDASLAVLLVDQVVEEGGERVADKGRQEDQRDERVLEAVVRAQVRDEGAVGGVVHAHDEQGPERGEDPERLSSRLVPPLDGVRYCRRGRERGDAVVVAGGPVVAGPGAAVLPQRPAWTSRDGPIVVALLLCQRWWPVELVDGGFLELYRRG